MKRGSSAHAATGSGIGSDVSLLRICDLNITSRLVRDQTQTTYFEPCKNKSLASPTAQAIPGTPGLPVKPALKSAGKSETDSDPDA
jgi:hypothetical protein